MIRKLRFRLTAVCTFATVLVLAVMAIVVLRYSELQIRAQVQQRFLSAVNSICYNLRGTTVVDSSWIARMEASNDLYIRIETRGGPLLHSEHNETGNMLTLLALQAAEEQGYRRWNRSAGGLAADLRQIRFSHGGVAYYAAVCTIPMSEHSLLEVTAIKSTEDDNRQIARLRLVFACSMAAAALCLFLFAWRFTNWASRPIEENHRRQNRFIAAASHEMRSPLAVIQASAGALHRATPEQARTLADAINAESRRMKRMLGDLLLLAAADGNRLEASLEAVEPDTLLLGVSERLEMLAQERGIRLRVELPEKIPRCLCDPDRIEQLLYILADNALRFTPGGGTVTLGVARRGRNICFSVSDTGPGVPDDKKQLIFDRFYQADDARTDREHYGLGLSVAKEIAELHRGDIWVSDADGGGAEFLFTVPAESSNDLKKKRRLL